MKRTLGTLVALGALLATAAPAGAEEQTRESYKAQVEPLCKANRRVNERIMAGARRRVNRNLLRAAGMQFIRLSRSFGGLVARLAKVPPPPADRRRVRIWLKFLRLLKVRLRVVGKVYREGKKVKATHKSILAERSGLTANNVSIVFGFRHCRISRFGKG